MSLLLYLQSGMGVVLVEGEAQFARMVSPTPKQTTSAASGTGICSMDFSCSPYIVNGIIIVMANIFGILAWSH